MPLHKLSKPNNDLAFYSLQVVRLPIQLWEFSGVTKTGIRKI